MPHDAFENRQVSIIDKGTHIEFAEHQFDEVTFYEKVENTVPLVLVVENENFSFKRGDVVLKTFVYDDVLTPKFNTQEELASFLFEVINTVVAGGARGIEAFFLEARGFFGTGGGWADSGFISNLPVLLFAQSLTERATYMFYALARTLFDATDPEVAFVIYSTTAPSLGNEDVRWQLEARYIAENEGPGKAADETLLITQSLDHFTANERQDILRFTLDRTLVTDQDVIMFTLERIGGDAADTYGVDVAVGQAGIILETLIHNP